jgi:hypothetical protein
MPVKTALRHACFVSCLILAPLALRAEPVVIADFGRSDATQGWRFFTDQVMGGVSDGSARIEGGALRLTGTVSTDNNGGFIQARLEGIRLPDNATALTIRTQGNGQDYFIHLRTTGTRLPWQYYQARFTARPDWQTVTLPLAAFKPSGRLLRSTPRAGDVRSVALVAYGRDHEADVSLSEISAE